jgi:hypothetical protein
MAYIPDNTAGLSENDKILADAKKWYEECISYNNEWAQQAKKDVEFFSGSHWAPEVIDGRTRDKRPILTIDRTTPIINKILNEFRQNLPGAEVRGKDEASSVKTANVIEGIIRHITNDSDTETAFDTASLYQVVCGKGYLRLMTDFEDSNSFDQCIKTSRICDPIMVQFPEWLCTEIDWSDAPYCFISYTINKEEFKEKYPKAKMAEWSNGNYNPVWMTEKEMILVEMYLVEKTPKTIYKVQNIISQEFSVVEEKPDPTMFVVLDERETENRKVKWYLLSDQEVLDEKDWLGNHIPIVPVLGQELSVAGKKVYSSLIKSLREPQKQYNWGVSAQVERIAMNPLSPWVMTEGQIEGHEKDWQESNVKHIAALQYKAEDIMGHPVPPPFRTPIAGSDPAISEMVMEAGENLKAVSGVYDASLSTPGKETAGVAIDARQEQSDQANYHYYDNLCKAARHLYRQICDLIPKIYDSNRMVRILGEDDVEDIAYVNAHYAQINKNENGEVYDLSAGKYDVVVKAGPSFRTKKEKTVQLLTNLFRANPQYAASMGDLLAKMLDAPQEVIDRARALLPPELQTNSKDGNPADKAMIQKQNAAMHQLMNQVEALKAELKNKLTIEQAKTEREIIKSEAELKKALIENDHEIKLESHKAAHALGMQAHGHNLKQTGAGGTQQPIQQPAQPAVTQGA